MEKALWGKRVVDKLYAGENNIDATIRSLSELMMEIQDAQADLNVSAVATNPVLSRVVEAMAALQQARTSLTNGHRRLEDLGKELGVRTTGYGVTTQGKNSAEFAGEQPTAAREAI
jgi:hypothetical protein